MTSKEVKKDLEKLARLREDMRNMSNEYNKISKRLGYGVRTGIIVSSMRPDDDTQADNLWSEAYEKGLSEEEAEQYVEDNWDNEVNVEEGGSYRDRWADIESSEYGWFPSGINC